MAMISAWREVGKMCGFYKPETIVVPLSEFG
jgi:hypothetical protein